MESSSCCLEASNHLVTTAATRHGKRLNLRPAALGYASRPRGDTTNGPPTTMRPMCLQLCRTMCHNVHNDLLLITLCISCELFELSTQKRSQFWGPPHSRLVTRTCRKTAKVVHAETLAIPRRNARIVAQKRSHRWHAETLTHALCVEDHDTPLARQVKASRNSSSYL